MRVGFLVHRLAPVAPTGVDRYARELLSALARRVELTCVVASAPEADEPDWLPPNVEMRRLAGPRKVRHLAWSVLHRPRVDVPLGNPHVVHSLIPSFPVPARVPVVYTVHDVMVRRHPDWFGPTERFGFRHVMRHIAGGAAVIASSPFARQELVTEFGVPTEQITVIAPGVSPRFFAAVDDATIARVTAGAGVRAGDYLLYVGHVSARKNVAVLPRALGRLPDPPVLLIAGSGGDGVPAVRDEIERADLADRVRFLGYVRDEDLPALMAGARALVLPSRHEGFGFTPLEAMAVGTPAIVAATTALPATVGDAALLADPDDADSWAEAIASLSHPEKRAALSRAGRAYARGFTWERTAAETVAVYRNLTPDS